MEERLSIKNLKNPDISCILPPVSKDKIKCV